LYSRSSRPCCQRPRRQLAWLGGNATGFMTEYSPREMAELLKEIAPGW
jgi:hypothetical protein